MRCIQIHNGERRVLVVVCDPGEEGLGAVTGVVRDNDVRAASVTAVGGFSEAVLGYYDRDERDFLHIPVREQTEVLSVLGDVADLEGQPQLNLHAVLGRRDGTTVGGHLLRGIVWPTLEVIITEVAPELAKRFDPATGLAVIRP